MPLRIVKEIHPVYKLTNRKMNTMGPCEWQLGRWHEIYHSDHTRELCTKSWFHCYPDAALGMLLYPWHLCFRNPRLFRAEATGYCRSDVQDLGKLGYTKMRLIRELKVPEITVEHYRRFMLYALLCIFSRRFVGKRREERKMERVSRNISRWFNGNSIDFSDLLFSAAYAWGEVGYIVHKIEHEFLLSPIKRLHLHNGRLMKIRSIVIGLASHHELTQQQFVSCAQAAVYGPT